MGSGLREGWEVRKLGDICEIYNGSTPLRTKKEYWEDGTINWFTINDIRTQGRVVEYTRQTISENGFKNSSLKLLPINTILLCCTASVGEFAITKIELTTNQQFNGLVIKDNQQLLPNFLYYFSSTLKKILLNLSGKATIDFVSMTKLKKIEIPFPPLQEQKKIVAILDEAFLAIDKAKANAVLNLQNAKELFESYLQEVFENRGEGWEEKSLKDITIKIGSGATPRGGKSSYKEVGLSLVRSMNVHDFEFKVKNLAFIDDTQAEKLSNVSLQKEDILLNITGASIARCCMIPEQYLPARVNQHVSIIRANKDIINPLFLSSLLTSKFYKKQILEIGEQGATRQAITKVQLENFIITFPKTIEEQKQIVKKLNDLQKQTKKLESIYTQKLQDLDELKKSILQKAFNGELV